MRLLLLDLLRLLLLRLERRNLHLVLLHLHLMLLRQSQRRHRTPPLAGTGELMRQLKLPYQLTEAQRRVIREIRGEPHLFAVYGCTPLVRFPLAALKDGAHVRGDTIGELGTGATRSTCLPSTIPSITKTTCW